MTGRYEIVDSHHPDWRGQRFTALSRAERELARAVPPGRFYIRDRQENRETRWPEDDSGSVEPTPIGPAHALGFKCDCEE